MIALLVVLLACLAILIGFVMALAVLLAHERALRRELDRGIREREALLEALRRRIVMRVYDREDVTA
jgi:hypothetical protein